MGFYSFCLWQMATKVIVRTRISILLTLLASYKIMIIRGFINYYKIFAYLSIVNEGYLGYFIGMKVYCVYLIWLSVLIIYDVTLATVIMSELHHVTSWLNPVICVSIWLYVFVMHDSVQMTIHIIIGFCHAQLCKMPVLFLILFGCVSVKWEYFHASLLLPLW